MESLPGRKHDDAPRSTRVPSEPSWIQTPRPLVWRPNDRTRSASSLRLDRAASADHQGRGADDRHGSPQSFERAAIPTLMRPGKGCDTAGLNAARCNLPQPPDLVRPRTDEEARRTVAEFATIDPTYVVPMHCTGEVFIQEAMRIMPQKVIRPYVGAELAFSAS